MNHPRLVKMSDRERELILRCADGRAELLPILHHLFNYRQRLAMFEWLVRNHKTGHELLFLYKGEAKGSLLGLAKFIISQINRERADRILVGRDFLA